MTTEATAPLPPAARPRRLRRLLVIGLLALVALPPLGLGLGNLALRSPWALAWLESRIAARSGLHAELQAASCTPWSGIRLRGLTLKDRDEADRRPLLEVDEIRLQPVWRAWLRGRRELASIELIRPRIALPPDLPREWLARSREAPPLPADPLARVAADPAAPPADGLPEAGELPPEPLLLSPGEEPPADSIPQPLPPLETEPALPPDPTTRWLRIVDGSFELLRGDGTGALFSISRIDGRIPTGGGAARDILTLEDIVVAGQQMAERWELPVRWDSPALGIGPVDLEALGLRTRVVLQTGPAPGLPLRLGAQLPSQSWSGRRLAGVGLEAERFQADLRFQGLLLSPPSWQGEFLAQTTRLRAETADFGAETFDHGQALVALRGPVLSCVDARLLGESLSFLGNGRAQLDGQAAAVLRIVAAPDALPLVGRRLLPGHEGPWAVAPLSSPQRAALDIGLWIDDQGGVVRAGSDGPVLDLESALRPPRS